MPYVQFGDPPEYRAAWNGPWPPPERMGLARGTHTGAISVFDPEKTPAAHLDEVREVAEVSFWARLRYSRLPADLPHVERGALYVREPERSPP